VGGKIVLQWDDDGQKAHGQRDRDLDGIFEWDALVDRGTTDDEQTAIITIDPLRDGHVARRATYTRAGDVIHVEIEAIDDATGELSSSSSFDTQLYQQSDLVIPPTPGTGPGDCTPEQAKQAADAMKKGFNRGAGCLASMAPDLVAQLTSETTKHGIKLTCKPLTPSPLEPADGKVIAQLNKWWDSWIHGGSADNPVEIFINPDNFFDPDLVATELEREQTLWHELLHDAMGEHDGIDVGDPDKRALADPVYACASLCFDPKADRCNCAACLATNKCDPRCTPFPDCPKPRHLAECKCHDPDKQRWFEADDLSVALSDCEKSNCKSGLLCFAAKCKAVDYSCPPPASP
jgi:hypothetical protein